jgi:hypothetical protein
VGHPQEQEQRQLLDVIPVVDCVVAQGVAVVPEFLNDLLGKVGYEPRLSTLISKTSCPQMLQINADGENSMIQSSADSAQSLSRPSAEAAIA